MSTFNTGIESDLSIGRLGKPGGFAQLGSDGKVLPEQLPTHSQGAPPQDSYTIRRILLNRNIILGSNDNVKNHIVNVTTDNLTIDLPNNPINGTNYIIKLNRNSSFGFTINSVFIEAGETYEVAFDGTEWVEY